MLGGNRCSVRECQTLQFGQVLLKTTAGSNAWRIVRVVYAYDIGIGYMYWTNKLIDTQQFSNSGVDLYIRVAYSKLGKLFLFYIFM